MNERRRTTGRVLNKLWRVDAAHALYLEDGKWYHHLERFPGALFDFNGYVLFRTREDYLNSPYLQHC
jgi:glycosidase